MMMFILANGEMLLRAKKAMELLKKEGIICRLYSIHTLKPIDHLTIEKIARECSYGLGHERIAVEIKNLLEGGGRS